MTCLMNSRNGSRRIKWLKKNQKPNTVVNTILFLVDPMTTDFSYNDVSDEFKEWLKKNQMAQEESEA